MKLSVINFYNNIQRVQTSTYNVPLVANQYSDGFKSSFKGYVSLTDSEKQAIEMLRSNKPEQPERIVMITDPNHDPDDLVTYVISAQLQKEGFIKMEAIVTTLGDQETRTKRAKFAKGAFNSLGLDDIQVGVGSDYKYYNDKRVMADQKFFDDIDQNALRIVNDGSNINLNGQDLLLETFQKAEDKSLTIAIIAGMTDIAKFISNHEELFKQKVEKVVIMGGIDSEFNSSGCIQPDELAYNNITDIDAAKEVFQKVQELEIPLITFPRESAYKAPLTPQFFKELSDTSHLIGKFLLGVFKDTFKGSWEIVTNGINPGRTADWFFNRFTSLNPDNVTDKVIINNLKEENDPDKIFKYATKTNMYDPLTLLCSLGTDFCFNTEIVSKNQKSPVQIVHIKDSTMASSLVSGLSKISLNKGE